VDMAVRTATSVLGARQQYRVLYLSLGC
jgi:hypothetical protein